MSANLSIKNVPDTWVKQLRQIAAKNHRSLQGELMAIVEKSLEPGKMLTPEELLKNVQQLGLNTPPESVKMIREDRSGR